MTRRRIPDEVKILTGTFRKDESGAPAPSPAAQGVPIRPYGMKGEGRKHWDEVVPRLMAMGVVGVCDTPILVVMCDWWAVYQAYREKAVVGTATWREHLMGGRAWDRYLKIAERFGMTAWDRTKIRVPVRAAKGVSSRKREAE